MFRPLAAAVLLLAPAAAAAQALTPAESARIDTLVTTTLAKTGVPSAVVAVVRGNRLVFTRAWGKASEAIPVARPDLPYQIASNSKQFTAAALLLLQRDGKLSLDDTVARWLPGVSGGEQITLRQLLSHTSGLQDYWPQDYSFKAMETPTTPQGIVDRWAKKPLDFTPGSQWQYSNTGYVVAGLVAEKAAGEPLNAFLQRRVFAPLGIRALSQDDATGLRYPVGYHRYALGPVRVEPAAARGWLYAAGEWSMNAADLARWDIARLERTVLAPEDWAAQETPVRLSDGRTTDYGLGVQVGTRGGHRFVGHTGEAVGFLTANTVFPDDKAAVVVFTNADFSDAYTAIANGVADVVLAGAAPSAEEAPMTARARKLFDGLRTGRLDRGQLTENAAYYFTKTAVRDYRASLAALGTPTGFALARPARLRGGFVNRVYTVTYPGRKLTVVTYAEPDGRRRWEQFLVQPAS
jgi:D-alanyl-D-alanine carboxypeptidase